MSRIFLRRIDTSFPLDGGENSMRRAGAGAKGESSRGAGRRARGVSSQRTSRV